MKTEFPVHYIVGETLFIWWGGSYIDIFHESVMGNTEVKGKFYKISDHCINVWDSATDTPTIPRTKKAFISKCEQWLKGMSA